MKLKNTKLLVQSDKGLDVTNPADGALITKVADQTADDTNAAIDKADEAFQSFKDTLAQDRSNMLNRWAQLMRDNIGDLATIMTMEQGKPIKESRTEIEYAAGFLAWFAEEAKRTYGDIIPTPFKSARVTAIKQPVGVCAIITPWNFPAAMITRKVGAAIAAGCTTVCKPAAATPLSALALKILADEAGIPDGVFNIVTTSNASEFSEPVSKSNTVKKLSFTGSTKVGKILMEQSASTLKKLSLELGGNAPFIVFDDADVKAAATGVVQAKFRNAGQVCIGVNRIYVHESVYDEFNREFFKQVQDLKVGNGMGEASDIGPLINQDAVDQVEEFVEDALDKGGELQIGGKKHDAGDLFFEPTVITGAHKDMKLACNEIFGPVAAIFKFKDEDDVIAQANDTEYGLAAYFYGRDIARVWDVAEQLEFGMVGVNAGAISTPVAPFGGMKHSGFGIEGSKYGINEYLNTKYVLMGGLA